MSGLAEVASLLRAGERFLLLTHRGPDGDGLGSMVGCAEILKTLGKKPLLLLPDSAPEGLRELAGVREAPRELDPQARFDATVVFDCGDPRLLQNTLPPPERSGKVIVLDHHRVAIDFGDLCWRDADAAATGVMVYALAQHLGAPLSQAAAHALYVAIVADTGGFRYANTSGQVLRIAADLVDRGADPWAITQATLESFPAERLVLLQRVLATLQVSLEGRFATLELTDEMLRGSNAHPEMTGGFVNYARAIRGVEVGALLSKKGTSLRASLRGRGHADVARVAATFGGGGHHDAAGCEIAAASLAEARQQLETAVAEELARAGPVAEAS